MVTLGGCHFLYLVILVPYNLFRLFLVHKISAYKYIYKNGEKKWEKKKKKEFPASWAGGDFGPPGRECARAARLRPSWPSCAGRRRGTAPWRGPARQREGGADGVDGNGGRGFDRGPAGDESRGGSPPWVRFFGGEVVAKHGRVKGVTRVG
jgi:hypothetical protein